VTCPTLTCTKFRKKISPHLVD